MLNVLIVYSNFTRINYFSSCEVVSHHCLFLPFVASDHLTLERSKIDHKIALLHEERDLIDKHLSEQKRKQDELQQTETGLIERSQLVRSTLLNVQAEMEKFKLIVEGLQGMDV